LRMHHALRRLYRAGLGRKSDLNLAFQLARSDMTLIVAERARESPLSARAKERHRSRIHPTPRKKTAGARFAAGARSAS
jgi:hypothetical protein